MGLHTIGQVKPPYNQLQDVTRVNTDVIAATFPDGACAAQRCRHLALLGAQFGVQEAKAGEAPPYVLVTQATVTTVPGALTRPLTMALARRIGDEPLRVAVDTGDMHTTMQYVRVPAKVFQRVYRKHETVEPFGTGALVAPVCQEATVQNGSIMATVAVKPEHCVGHFPRYPCLPVSVLMEVIEARLAVVTPETPEMARAAVTASSLAWAGETVTIDWQRMEDEQIEVKATAGTPAREIARVTFTMRSGRDDHHEV